MSRHRLRRKTHNYLGQRKHTPPSLPVAIMYDNFIGTNEASLASRVPAVRNNLNTWAITQGAFNLNGNKLEARFPSTGQAVCTFDCGTANVDVRVKFRFPTTGSSRTAGITFRYTSNSDRWFMIASMSLNKFRINEVTGGTTTIRAEGDFNFQADTDYTMRLVANGDVISATIEGVGSVTYTSSVGNTRTRHGLIANNTVTTGGPIIFDDFIMLTPPNLYDVAATVSGSSYRNAKTKESLTIVDNNLNTDFAGAATQKANALSNLSGKFHNVNMFIESFGNNENLLGSWNGISDDVEDLPAISLANWQNYWSILDAGISPDTWGVYGWRLPWQFTGSTNSSGVTTKSTSNTYSSESRRLLTNKRAQFVEWVARWSSELMESPYGIRRFYLGSEGKGFQSVVPVPGIRASRSQSWDWDDYTGTPGRADMGFFAFYLAFREGLMLGAERASVEWSTIKIVAPYPVIAHKGSLSESPSDAVTFDSRNDWLGSSVDFSDVNGSNVSKGGWGWPYRASSIFLAEFIRLLQVHGISSSEWAFGSDFGTFNNDNVPTLGMNDHDITYKRVKGHNAFYKKVIEKYGFTWEDVEKFYPEYYFKAMNPMDVVGSYFIEEALRDSYQASIRAVGLFAAYEDGIDQPDMWSPFGRGDQSYLGGDDENQWYGGCIKRTVTDNNNHPGSAVTNGGDAQAALTVIDSLKTHFPPGTPLHSISFTSEAFRGIATSNKAAVVNQSNQTVTLSVNGSSIVSFAPYEFKIVNF